MESVESVLMQTWLGRQALDWYRRVIYHHDYLFTSVILMAGHAVLCAMTVVFAPHSICSETNYVTSTNNEQFVRWLMLGAFAAVPLFLDILFDHFKSTANVIERNQWIARIILLLALVCPSLVIAFCNDLSPYIQCKIVSSIVPAQTMILVSSIFCTMFREHMYRREDDENGKSRRKFSIEKRALALMVHMTLSRGVTFVYFLADFDNGFKVGVMIVNVLVIVHYFFVLTRYMYVLLMDRVNGEFTSPHALSDFLYATASFVFLFCGMIVLIILQISGVLRTPPDVAAITLSIYRLIFLVGFTLFISVIPGRVGMFAARLEHQKLQTRLNLIRYVSHEMRSPLNTAFLGLEFVTGELSRMHQEHLAGKLFHVGGTHPRGLTMAAAASGIASNSGDRERDLELGVGGVKPLTGALAGGRAGIHGRETARADRNQDIAEIYENIDRSGGTASAPAPHRYDTGLRTESNMSSLTNANAAKSMVSEVLDIVKQINASCNIALYTLNDLLTFDKLDEKKLEVELQPVNAWHFALNTAKPFKINAKESQVDFTISCGSFETRWYRRHLLRADEFKLSQVLRNLISNALKFTPAKGKVHMHVEMLPNYPTSGILSEGSTLGNLVRISVRDTGPGISAENLTKLFGQYVQFNPSKLQKGGGSGLGLWISKSIVEMHGGTVRAVSVGEGKGCTFYLELPLFEERGMWASFEADPTLGVLEPLEEGVVPSPPASMRLQGQPTLSEPQDSANVTPIPPSVPPTPSSVAGTGVLGRFFSGSSMHGGAKQFLNHKVKFKVNTTSSRTVFNGSETSEVFGRGGSSKEHYNIGRDQSSEVSGEDGEEEGVHEYSDAQDKPLFGKGSSFGGGAGGGSMKGGSTKGGFGVGGSSKKRYATKLSAVVPVDGDTPAASGVTTGALPSPAGIRASSSDTGLVSEDTKGTVVIDIEGQSMTQALTSGLASPVPAPAARTWATGLRMLAVDDTALNRKMMCRLLRAAGHEVHEAADGLECLYMLHCSAEGPVEPLDGPNSAGEWGLYQHYDAILIDENMPNMSGPEAVHRLRACGYNGLVIGVTGDCYADQMARFVQQGANAVLPKPLKVEALRTTLEQLWSADVSAER